MSISIDGHAKKRRKFWNNEKKQEFFKRTKPKNESSDKSPKLIEKISVPHMCDVSDLLAAGEKIIMWSYDEQNKYKKISEFPEYLRKGLDSSTYSATLWGLKHGLRCKPRLPPDPFVMVYSRWLTHDEDDHTITLLKEGHRILPAPPGLQGQIRWVKIWDDHIDYHYKPRTRILCDNLTSLTVTPEGVCIVPGMSTDDNDDE